MQIDVFKNGGFIGTFDQTSASYPTKDKKDVYAIKIEDTKDGMVILKIETFNHLPDENISSEYKYQLNNAWYRNDHKQTNLLNEPTKQIQVETNTIDEANKPTEPKA
ncbi:hypothetical protein JM47_01860 [Ureaplasma diversum]|uniref:Uncharacterized protein n=1 Tax=Ureaplasma diversum TaxID=42094 RepID=A0A0C5RLN7_9BACT|nr:hypothetical protein [Ureaplasma diversum]AJQ45337.1 hypothetical protein JM47_01860 [Ureaplasma diversum]